ncbi:MAG: hypothetical protein V1914_04605 [archaeon]
MDAYELVISLFALNPNYESAIKNNGIQRLDLIDNLLSKYPNPVLEKARIKPHRILGTSHNLSNALIDLIYNRVVRHWVPGDFLTWNFPLSPREYFDERILPGLSEEEVSQLEKLARSL